MRGGFGLLFGDRQAPNQLIIFKAEIKRLNDRGMKVTRDCQERSGEK